MGQHVLPGNPPIELTLRKSAQARRISLRVSRLDGRVTLTLPKGVSEREALAFAREKAAWLRSNLSQHVAPTAVALGAEIPVEGQMLQIVASTSRSVRQDGGRILVPGAAAQVPKRLAAYLKQRARDRLAAASDHYAGALGQPYARLTLRDTRSRWGSCTADRGLMYSWRLIMAPPEVLDYVAAHEVAHLAEMNHSPAFWAVVTRLYGDHKPPRRWLKDHGHMLHRYRFSD